ncbi:MAG: glutamate 5-kinase [Patescibacteria group bacterium]
MRRVVVKIGTKVLSRQDGTLDVEFLADLVGQVVRLRKQGIQVVLVTSGAVGAGKSLISLQDIKSDIVQKQVFAAVGQVKLMNTYSELFGAHGYHCAQVLATKEDFRDEQHYRNMQNCFEGLLLDNVVPVVNENDVVATTELLFTDNDELAGLVAGQLKADSLVILTGTEGILDNAGATVAEVNNSNREVVAGYINPDKSTNGRGGMASKFAVAKELSQRGISVHIVNGKNENILQAVVDGRGAGTHFAPQKS